MTPAGTLTALQSFAGANGFQPLAGLIQATDGNFYGTTELGGATSTQAPDGAGTVFKITPAGKLSTLYSFCGQPNCADGMFPGAALVQGAIRRVGPVRQNASRFRQGGCGSQNLGNETDPSFGSGNYDHCASRRDHRHGRGGDAQRHAFEQRALPSAAIVSGGQRH